MPKRKYPAGRDKKPVVREAKAEPYAREKHGRNVTRVALTIAGVKRRLKKPFKRSDRDIAWALEIAGIGEGPEDLSGRTREYLYGDK